MPQSLFSDDVETQMEIFKCFEGGECGNCSELFHTTNEYHWYGSRGPKVQIEKPIHYESNKVVHVSKYSIVECTKNCFCYNNNCQNRAVANMMEKPFPFARDSFFNLYFSF